MYEGFLNVGPSYSKSNNGGLNLQSSEYFTNINVYHVNLKGGWGGFWRKHYKINIIINNKYKIIQCSVVLVCWIVRQLFTSCVYLKIIKGPEDVFSRAKFNSQAWLCQPLSYVIMYKGLLSGKGILDWEYNGEISQECYVGEGSFRFYKQSIKLQPLTYKREVGQYANGMPYNLIYKFFNVILFPLQNYRES